MEKNNSNYYYQKMPKDDFFVDVIEKKVKGQRPLFYSHWHEHLQFFYITEGSGFMICNSQRFEVYPKDFVVVNSNELHYMESSSDLFSCHIIRVDFSFLNSSQLDSCQTKFLSPLSDNYITFHNLIQGNEQINTCAENIIKEYDSNQIGFELAIKSELYKLIVLLLRNYVERYLSKKELEERLRKLNKMRQALQYIDGNLSQKITLHELASITYLSDYHFCKLFKQVVGKSAIEYINMLRIEKALLLIKEGTHNITEVAMACGFSDSNYFSRAFKKYQGISPTAYYRSMIDDQYMD